MRCVAIWTWFGPLLGQSSRVWVRSSSFGTQHRLASAGRIRIEINQHYALADAVHAHRDLESRKTTGSSIFVI